MSERYEGLFVLTPYVQANSVLVIERRDSRDGTVSQSCPLESPAWDGYVAWPANLPRWRRA